MMAAVLSDLLVTLFIALFGVVLGWVLRAAKRRPTSSQDAGEGTNPEVQRAREILSRLQEVAASVAADVGQHSQRVEQINEELSASHAPETETVVGAVAKLLENNRRMQHRLATAEERLQAQARQIESHATEARTDPLTGLANRRALDAGLAHRLEEFRRLRRPFWMIMLDIDHFKKFNDTYGHQAGDEVLRGVAGVLRNNARNTDLVARYGGEELAVVFSGSSADAIRLVERTRQAIEQARFHFEGAELRVTVSIGLAEIGPGEDGAGLVRRADEALYASKKDGRNCGHWHDGQQLRRLGGQAAPGPMSAEPTAHQAAEGRGETPPASRQPGTPRSAAPRPAPLRAAGAAARSCVNPAESAAPAEPRVCVLTDLANRTAFCTMVSGRLAEWRRGGAAFGTVLLRVDRYAEITAHHGQHVGDLALTAVVRSLKATLREMDMVAHYDHATFAVLLPGTDLPGQIRVEERLRQAIAQCAVRTEVAPVPLTASVGGAEAMISDDGARLLRRTEESLDAATRSGGNCCYFHNGQWSEISAAALEKSLAARPA